MHSRCRSSNCKKQSSQQKLRINITRLDKQYQGKRNNGISNRSNPSHAQPVRHKSPDWTRHQRDNFVGKAQSADYITNAMFLPNEVSDYKGDGAIEKNEEADGEERNTEEVGGSLEGCCRGGEGD